MREVEFTDEFEVWWNSLTEAEQESVARSVELLRMMEPALGRPRVDTLKGSKFPNMKELRTHHGGEPPDALCVRSQAVCDSADRREDDRR